MKITIFGATGKIGQMVVRNSLVQGHEVIAYVRDPKKVTQSHPALKVVQGDILDQAGVFGAVANADAVICTLGMPLFNNDGLRAKGTKIIIAAMEKNSVSRLICLSAYGVGDSWSTLPFSYKYLIGPFLMRRLFADHNLQEKYIMESDLNWTIVRPGNFTKGDATGKFKYGHPIIDTPISIKISQPDVADFIIRQLNDLAWLHKAPTISY